MMRGADVLLIVLAALCGIVELILLYVDSVNGIWLWVDVLTMIWFFGGIIRYKITKRVPDEMSKWRIWIGILLLANALLLGFVWSYPISDTEMVLSSGFLITCMDFEETGWFITLKYDQIASSGSTN